MIITPNGANVTSIISNPTHFAPFASATLAAGRTDLSSSVTMQQRYMRPTLQRIQIKSGLFQAT